VITRNGISSAVSEPKLRTVSFGDYEQIAALGARYGLPKETYDEWAHLWAHNPVFRSLPEWPMGWVFESQENQIVGHVANVPLAYWLGEQRLIAAASRSVMVDPLYRSYSFQLLSQFFRQKQADLFLATTVNAQATGLYEVFRAQRVPTGAWDRSAFWITNYRGFGASVWKMKALPGKKLVSYPVGISLWVRDALHGRAFKARKKSKEPELCASFDDRFQAFWQTLCARYPGRLLADRSRESLEWHLKSALAKKWAWIFTLSNGAELSAYALFVRQDNPTYGLVRMRLVDFQTLNGDSELLRPLLCGALEQCRRDRIHMLEASGLTPEKHRAIEGLAPGERTLDAWRYFYKAAQPALAERLKDPAVWDPSCLDGDAGF